MWKTLDDAALDSFNEQLVERERREEVLFGALLSIVNSLDVVICPERLRTTIRETATNAMREVGVTKGEGGKRENRS